MKLALIGLGSMGYGMAVQAVRAGLETWGVDIDEGRMETFRGEGGQPGALDEVAGTLDAVAVVVLNAAQTETVLFGPRGIAPKLPKGAVVLGCATVPPGFARDMAARCDGLGLHYLDAPISGGAGRAADGTLSVMASGAPEAFAAARPVLDAVSETVFDLGAEPGAGSAMKAVNQMLAGIHLAAMGEAVTFAMSQGVSAATFNEIIPKCAGSSWMLENRTPHIVDGDYTPRSTVNIWPKDLGIVLDIARVSQFAAPMTATALQQFLAAAGQGLGAEDDAAIAKVYARNIGLELPGTEGDG